MTSSSPAPPPATRSDPRAGRRLRWRVAGLAVVAVASVVVTLAVRETPPLRALQRATVDLRFALRGRERPDSQIAVVGLDPTSVAHLPRYPFSRRIHARVLLNLHRAGARVIVYDPEFDQPTTTGADDALFNAATKASPVVFATSVIRAGGQTTVLGGNANLRSIHDAAASSLLTPDPDGVIRHLSADSYGLGSIPEVVQRIVQHRTTSASALRSAGGWIDYAGPPGTYRPISFWDVYRDRFDRAAVRGKIVLVGLTAPVFQDVHPTPVGGAMTGVEIWANAIATLLRGLPLANAAGWLELVLILATAIAICAVAIRARPLWVATAGLVGLAAWGVAAVLAFNGGVVLEVPPVALVIVLATGGACAVTSLHDARELRRLRQLFAAGSPELVEDVLRGGRRLGLAPTAVIAGYRLEGEISRGGMGIVYRARQLELDRPVAIKVILPEHADDPVHRARFELESRAAAALEHPHVIPVYATGEHERILYIVMRLVHGSDLGRELAHVALDPSRSMRIIEQIAAALDAAHAMSLVHRDVKPANVLVTADGPEHAYLTDFGIASWAESGSRMTRDGWVGTVDYAAPEQIRGETVDGRADTYALAALLFHCLTGTPPYPRDGAPAVMLAHLGDPPPSASACNPGLPVGIDAVIAQGLAKRPEDRPASATAFAVAAAAALGVSSSLPAGLPTVSSESTPGADLQTAEQPGSQLRDASEITRTVEGSPGGAAHS